MVSPKQRWYLKKHGYKDEQLDKLTIMEAIPIVAECKIQDKIVDRFMDKLIPNKDSD